MKPVNYLAVISNILCVTGVIGILSGIAISDFFSLPMKLSLIGLIILFLGIALGLASVE